MTGRGRSGQACAARRPATAARADTLAASRSSTIGPVTMAPAPKCVAIEPAALSASSTPPSTTTRRSPWTAHEASKCRARADRLMLSTAVGRVALRRESEHDAHAAGGFPAQRGGPRPDGLVGLAAQHRVDDERLEPGVPGAALLGGAGVHLGGGEGDLAREQHHRLADRGRVARVDDGLDLLLDDADRRPHHLDRLLQGDHAGQLARRGAEDVVRAPVRRRRGCRNHSTNDEMPLPAIRPIQDRSSALRARNHGSSSCILAIAAWVREPTDFSSCATTCVAARLHGLRLAGRCP